MRIGITADIRVSLFSNGINQNAMYLAMMYSDMGHQVDVIGPSQLEGQALKELQALKIDQLNYVPIKDSITTKYDLIITVGLMIEQIHYDLFKKNNPDFKFVAYKCGNELLTDMESILYPDTHTKRTDIFASLKPSPTPDAIWSIPQMESTNLHYYMHLLKTDNATVVPFVWDPIVIENYKTTYDYKEWDGHKGHRIGVMEPNISIMKNLLVPMTVADRYQSQGGKLDNLYLFSAKKLAKNKRLLTLLRQCKSDLMAKTTAEDRMPTMRVLNLHVDAVVSWQIENNLNYLYFDIAWMGWPIIHNANLCQDVGYYYEGQNIHQATDLLHQVFEQHDHDYKDKNRQAISRFTRQNPQLIQQYEQLTNDVINGTFKRYSYDWKTNSIS